MEVCVCEAHFEMPQETRCSICHKAFKMQKPETEEEYFMTLEENIELIMLRWRDGYYKNQGQWDDTKLAIEEIKKVCRATP